MMHKIISPIYIKLEKYPKDKKLALNLNVYRNLHYNDTNKMKSIYSIRMFDQLYQLKFKNKIDLEFVLYRPNKGKMDRANVLCIVEKFLSEALVKTSCIIDDSDKNKNSTKYRTGGIDTDNPRAEIFITEANGAS